MKNHGIYWFCELMRQETENMQKTNVNNLKKVSSCLVKQHSRHRKLLTIESTWSRCLKGVKLHLGNTSELGRMTHIVKNKHKRGGPLESCDIWDTDNKSDKWESDFMTITAYLTIKSDSGQHSQFLRCLDNKTINFKSPCGKNTGCRMTFSTSRVRVTMVEKLYQQDGGCEFSWEDTLLIHFFRQGLVMMMGTIPNFANEKEPNGNLLFKERILTQKF